MKTVRYSTKAKRDFLLIWIDTEHDVIEVVRIGSHSELFGKK